MVTNFVVDQATESFTAVQANFTVTLAWRRDGSDAEEP